MQTSMERSMPDFLPRRGFDFLNWSRAFDQQINSDPQAFGIRPEDAAEYAMRHAAFAEAMQTANAPGSRTVPSIARKSTAEAALKQLARALVRAVKLHAGVTPSQRIGLGLSGGRAG